MASGRSNFSFILGRNIYGKRYWRDRTHIKGIMNCQLPDNNPSNVLSIRQLLSHIKYVCLYIMCDRLNFNREEYDTPDRDADFYYYCKRPLTCTEQT